MGITELQALVNDVFKSNYEDPRVHELAEALQTVLDAATLRPCHCYNRHNQDSNPAHGVCMTTTQDTSERILEALGVFPLSALPHELHPEGTCDRCYTPAPQERYREKQRTTWAWAGLTPPAEMAEPAPDTVQPGDTKLVLSALTEDFQSWQDVTRTLTKTLTAAAGEPRYFATERYWAIIASLLAEGRVEKRDISVRIKPQVDVPEQVKPWLGQKWERRRDGTVARIIGVSGSTVSVRLAGEEPFRVRTTDFMTAYSYLGKK